MPLSTTAGVSGDQADVDQQQDRRKAAMTEEERADRCGRGKEPDHRPLDEPAERPHQQERQHEIERQLAQPEPRVRAHHGEDADARHRQRRIRPRDEAGSRRAGERIDRAPQDRQREDDVGTGQQEDLAKAQLLVIVRVGTDAERAGHEFAHPPMLRYSRGVKPEDGRPGSPSPPRPSTGQLIGGFLAGLDHARRGEPKTPAQIEEQYNEPWSSADGLTVEGLEDPVDRPERPDRSGAKL